MKSLLAVLLLMGLTVGCSGNSNRAEATAASPAAPATSAAPTADELSAADALAGKSWRRKEYENKMDGKKSVVFSIYTTDVPSTDTQLAPGIQVRCAAGEPAIASFLIHSLSDGNVRIKFDDGPIIKQSWHLFEGDWFPKLDDKKAIAKGLLTAKKLSLEYSPAGSATQLVTFNAAGFHETASKEPLCKF